MDARVGQIDLLDRKDLAMVRRSATDEMNRRRRWAITPEFKQELVVGLQQAFEIAKGEADARLLNEIVRTAAVLEKMNQDDEHLAEKNARLDEGKATEGQKIEVVYVNRIRPKGDDGP